jgi:hypothetical protein
MTKMERLAILTAFALVMSTAVIADPGGGCGASGCATDNPIVITPPQGDGSCPGANCAIPEPVLFPSPASPRKPISPSPDGPSSQIFA